jgi:hypothetical protein
VLFGALAGDFFAGGAFFSLSEVLPGFPAFGTKRGFLGITLPNIISNRAIRSQLPASDRAGSMREPRGES